MAITHAILSLALCALLLGCANPAVSTPRNEGQAAISTTICAILEAPENFNGKRVFIESFARPSVHFATLLYDPKCSVDVIALGVPKSVAIKGEVDAFLNEVWAGYPKPLPAPVKAKFLGVFQYHPSDKPSRLLVLEALGEN